MHFRNSFDFISVQNFVLVQAQDEHIAFPDFQILIIDFLNLRIFEQSYNQGVRIVNKLLPCFLKIQSSFNEFERLRFKLFHFLNLSYEIQKL
jgi:hypothetical protein